MTADPHIATHDSSARSAAQGGGIAEGSTFARALWRIAGADASSGNHVRLLRDGPATFDAMVRAITHAESEVALESYIVRDDTIGREIAGALMAAARRGVEVRVLADWVGSRGTSRAHWRALRDAGAEVRIFSPPGFRPWLGMLPRDHRKLLVVDEKIGITGGIGIGDEWVAPELKPRRRRRAGWRDTAVHIAGPAAADMARAFRTMWSRAGGEERRTSTRLIVRRAAGTEVSTATHQGAVIGIVEGEPWRLRIARALQIQAASARRSIWIANAYFVPSFAETEAICGAARDGVDVRVLVPGRYDHPWVRALTQRTYRRLLLNGVRVFEWKGNMMHAKTTVMDGRWTRVGSTDFNPLGVAINFELDAVIEDAELGAQAEAMFLEDLGRSTEISASRAISPG